MARIVAALLNDHRALYVRLLQSPPPSLCLGLHRMELELTLDTGPVLVPIKVQWYSVRSFFIIKLPMTTRMSGKAVMNERATSMIASRPTAGVPPFDL